jgi:hypothetical protein
MLLSIPQRDTTWKRVRAGVGLPSYADPDHKIEYSQAEIEYELHKNGFTCESIAPIVYDTPLAGPIDLLGGFSLDLYRRLAQWKRDAGLRYPTESTGFRIVARKDSDKVSER